MTPAASTAQKTPFTGGQTQRWLSLVARLALGGVMLAAALLKIRDPHQAAAAVQAYQLLPTGVAEYVGYALPVFELLLAIALLAGFRTRLAAAITSGLMVVFILAVASAGLRGLNISCGCFGRGGPVEAGHTLYLAEIARDLGFIGLGVWLTRFPASRLALNPTGVAPPLPDFDDDTLEDQMDESRNEEHAE